jgi:signal transduction histidine kinase
MTKTYEELLAENQHLRHELELYEQRDHTAQDALLLLVQMVETLKFSNLHLTSAMNLREVLESVLGLTIDLLRADNAHVFLINDGQLSLGASLRDGLPFVSNSTTWRFRLASAVMLRGEVVTVDDISLDPVYSEARLEGYTSGALLGVPLKLGKEIIGVMNFAFREARQFTQREQDSWELFAMQTAIVIENVRLYKQAQELRIQERQYYENLNRTKDMVMDMVSHDLKNPINVIKGYVHLIRRHGHVDDEVGMNALVEIEEGAQRMLTLVTDLLDLAKLETGLALHPAPTSLNKLIEDSLHHHRLLAEQKQIQLQALYLAEEDMLELDSKRMSQVINNLVSNAIKYTPQGGRIKVSAVAEDNGIRVSVQDNGLGIPKADLSKLFQKFFRVKSHAHAQIEGTGLGLAIVKEIITQHGGEIFVESEEGKGSNFIIDLPLRRVIRPLS